MADDSVVKLKIEGEVYEVDLDELELGELGTVEDLCGRVLEDIDLRSARGIQGLTWIALHRKNPRFTVEDASRIKLSAFEEVEDSADESEKPAAKKRPTKAA